MGNGNYNYINVIVIDGDRENQSRFMFSNAHEMEKTVDYILNEYTSKYKVPFINLSNSNVPDIKRFQIKYETKSINITMNYGYEQSRDIMRFIKETINM